MGVDCRAAGPGLRHVPDSIVFVRSGLDGLLSFARVSDGELLCASWEPDGSPTPAKVHSVFEDVAASCHVMAAHGASSELARLRRLLGGRRWSEPLRRCTLSAAQMLMPGRVREWSLSDLVSTLESDASGGSGPDVSCPALDVMRLSVLLREVWAWSRDCPDSSMLAMLNGAHDGWRMRSRAVQAAASCADTDPATRRQVSYVQRLVRQMGAGAGSRLAAVPSAGEWSKGQASAAISVLLHCLPSSEAQRDRLRSALSESRVRFLDLSMALSDGRRASRMSSLSMAQASLGIDMLEDSGDPQWSLSEWMLPSDDGAAGSGMRSAAVSCLRDHVGADDGPSAEFSAALLSVASR